SDGHIVLDLGSFSTDPVDYPDFVRVVGQAVLRGFAEAGVLLCESGVGASIAANKFRSVRAAFCPDVPTARQSRERENANVLCLSAAVVDQATAVEIATAWAVTPFSGAEPHARRVAKIARLEESMAGPEKERVQESAPAARAEPAASPRSDPAAASPAHPTSGSAAAGTASAAPASRPAPAAGAERPTSAPAVTAQRPTSAPAAAAHGPTSAPATSRP